MKADDIYLQGTLEVSCTQSSKRCFMIRRNQPSTPGYRPGSSMNRWSSITMISGGAKVLVYFFLSNSPQNMPLHSELICPIWIRAGFIKNTWDKIPDHSVLCHRGQNNIYWGGNPGQNYVCQLPWIVTGLTLTTSNWVGYVATHRLGLILVDYVHGSDRLLIYALHSQIKNDSGNVLNELKSPPSHLIATVIHRQSSDTLPECRPDLTLFISL